PRAAVAGCRPAHDARVGARDSGGCERGGCVGVDVEAEAGAWGDVACTVSRCDRPGVPAFSETGRAKVGLCRSLGSAVDVEVVGEQSASVLEWFAPAQGMRPTQAIRHASRRVVPLSPERGDMQKGLLVIPLA